MSKNKWCPFTEEFDCPYGDQCAAECHEFNLTHVDPPLPSPGADEQQGGKE